MTCEVWLELSDADLPGEDAGQSVAWRWRVRARSGSAEFAWVSPKTEQVATLVRTYTREFRSWRVSEREQALAAERSLLNLGRALGDALVDPAYDLLTFCEMVEREGVASLHFALVSDQHELQALPWELLILPDSAYVLAAAGAAFVRAPAGARPFETTARELALSAERPLGHVYVDASSQRWRSTARVSSAWTQLGWQGALRYRCTTQLSSLESDGDRSGGSCHIVHWSGTVSRPDGTAHLGYEDRSGAARTIDARSFVDRARRLGAELLILEPDAGSETADAIALEALEAGIDNVLIVAEPRDAGWPSPWTSELFELLGAGLGLRQAVIETRKRLQRALLEARQVEPERPHAPQQWHALRHYSRCDVVFFAGAQQRVPFESTETYVALRGSLFGFEPNLLPPQAPDLGDPAAIALLRLVQSHGAGWVETVRGGGLSHALHRAALLARANGDVERAYYWDFARERFTLRDILEMVSGARGQTNPEQIDERALLDALRSQPELFVFDNLDVLFAEAGEATPAVAELVQFAERLAATGGLVLLGTHARPTDALRSSLPCVALPALDENESVALLQTTSPAGTAIAARLPLLEALRGNPLLIRRIFAHADEPQLHELLAEARQYGEAPDSLQGFHALRWQKLEPAWRRLLLAWLPCEALYLQLAMIAVDHPSGQRSAAGRELWTGLAAPDAASGSAAIAQLTAAGFVVSSGAGALVDRSALAFLRARATETREPALEPVIARLICEGALRILERQGQPAADVLANHLLANRALLRHQLEIAVRAGHFALSARVFILLHPLLVRAKLGTEAETWARALLEQAEPDTFVSENPLGAAAWLGLALRARLLPLSGRLELGVQHWADLLDRDLLTPNGGAHPLLPLVITLLEQVYDQTGDYAAYREVVRRACEAYRAAGNQPALVAQLKALAAVEHVLGDVAARDRIEDELVVGFCYEMTGGAELRQQTLGALAAMRLRRSDEEGAEALLDLLDRESDQGGADPLVLSLRGELALRRAQWELAGTQFCRLWSAALSGKRSIDVDTVARRLSQLERQLGMERFGELYAQHAGSAPTPESLGLFAA